METGTALKHRLIKIYEKGDEGDRTLIYVGRTAKTLEKYVEGIYTFEKVEQVVKTKVQQYMYSKGLENFEYEMDEKEYETIREAEAAKAAVMAKENPMMDSTMIYNRKMEIKVKEDAVNVTKKKFVRVNGRILVFNVDPIKEAQKEEKRNEKRKKNLAEYEKHGNSVKTTFADTTMSWD